jgi:hypothetical protein
MLLGILAMVMLIGLSLQRLVTTSWARYRGVLAAGATLPLAVVVPAVAAVQQAAAMGARARAGIAVAPFECSAYRSWT